MKDTTVEEILKGLDRVGEYNKLTGHGYEGSETACYICGIDPPILREAIEALLHSNRQAILEEVERELLKGLPEPLTGARFAGKDGVYQDPEFERIVVDTHNNILDQSTQAIKATLSKMGKS